MFRPSGQAKPSKTVGLVDAPGRRFITTLSDGPNLDHRLRGHPRCRPRRFRAVGKLPYDGSITSDGRHYIAGLFGEDGLVHLDLWAEPPAPRRILDGYGRGEQPLPVYKMPHLEGWALMGDRFLLPAVGRNELLAVDAARFVEIGRSRYTGSRCSPSRAPTAARRGSTSPSEERHHPDRRWPVAQRRARAEARPRRAAHGIYPRGHEVWVSVRDADRVDVYDARSFEKVGEVAAQKPSGIFFTARAHRIGQ